MFPLLFLAALGVGTGAVTGCVYTVGEKAVYNSVGTPSLTKLTISNDLLVAQGNNLHKIEKVELTGQGKEVTFNLNTQDLTSFSATAASALELTAGAVYDLLLSSANGSSIFPISITATTPAPYFSGASYYYSSTVNAGIGTSVPAERLDVAGDIRIGGQASTYLNTNTPQGMLSLYNYNYGIAKFTDKGTRVYTGVADDIQFGNISPAIAWPFSGGGVPYQVTEALFIPKMTIASTGNVGIGTTTPNSALQVVGAANVSGSLNLSATGTALTTVGNVGIGTTSPQVPLHSVGNVRFDIGTGATISLAANTNNPFIQAAVDNTSQVLSLSAKTGGVAQLNITYAGNVGIGTTTPLGILHLTDTGSSGAGPSQGSLIFDHTTSGGASSIVFRSNFNSGNDYGYIQYQDAATLGGANEMALLTIGTSNDPDDHLILAPSGNVGIGTTTPAYKLHVVGTAGLSTGTAWTNASDIRLKDILGDYEYGLDEVLQLHTVRFNYKKGNSLGLPYDRPMTGFIAQEVQKVIPDAVHKNQNGYLELNVDPIHWAVVNAVKEFFHKWVTDSSAKDRRIQSLELTVSALCRHFPDDSECTPQSN